MNFRTSLRAILALACLPALPYAGTMAAPLAPGSSPPAGPATPGPKEIAAPIAGPAGSPGPIVATVAPKSDLGSVVEVNVTDQPWDFFHPWSKHAPYSHHAIGVILGNGEVLVTAELVADANYVELEQVVSGEKAPATVEAVDYEADLALLKPATSDYLKDFKPIEIADAAVGDRVSVLQLGNAGSMLSTDVLITTAEVSKYYLEDIFLLTYQMTGSLQYREGGFTVPVVKNSKLIGLLMNYDSRTQNLAVIPAPVIRHFLHDAADKSYGGFPEVGVLFSSMRDPQLRSYVQMPAMMTGGVYVKLVEAEGPAAEAGIQVGDVLLAVGDKPVDQDGNYDDPGYGKVLLTHWISQHETGARVLFKILRGGKTMEIEVTLRHRAAEDYVIPPYVIGQPPKYYVLGGLVLQELSRQYLKEWSDWSKKAPEKFVYLDRYQSEIYHGNGRHLIIVSQVLPTADAIGFEDLSALIVTRINDRPINNFDDVLAALEHPINGFHKIEFDENPNLIYLDAVQVAKDAPDLMKTYGLPAISRAK